MLNADELHVAAAVAMSAVLHSFITQGGGIALRTPNPIRRHILTQGVIEMLGAGNQRPQQLG